MSDYRDRVGLIHPIEPLALKGDEMVVLIPEGAGHVREVRNGGEVAVLVFDGGKTLNAEVVPAHKARGRFLFRGRCGWQQGATG